MFVGPDFVLGVLGGDEGDVEFVVEEIGFCDFVGH